jgi:hypothetical protein
MQARLTDRVWNITEIAESIEEAEMAAMADTLVPAAHGN